MKLLIQLCVLCFLCFHLGYAQQDSIRHTVAKGETILQIAKTYNVTPYEIQQANQKTLLSLDHIKEGDILIIPKSKIIVPTTTSASDAVKASVAARTITHNVKKGETKYGLAKRFGVTITALEAQNPHIIAGLNEGHVLTVQTTVAYIPDTQGPSDSVASAISFDGYKTHLVMKGETLWGISHANGLTVSQLVGENQDVLTGILREGQTLKIPQVKATTPPYPTYLVVYGDTKYSLAKKYSTTIEALERLNPHIVRMLQAGHTIRIPSSGAIVKDPEVNVIAETTTTTQEKTPEEVTVTSETNNQNVSTSNVTEENPVIVQTETETQQTAQNEESKPKVDSNVVTTDTAKGDYISYVIKPKETLYGLSKKAGMSIAEFVVLNPQLKESVQIGTVIKMPRDRKLTEGSSKSVSTSEVSSDAFKDLSKTMNPADSKQLMFLLPFSESDFKTKSISFGSSEKDSDAFKQTHLEFYSGAKIAIDSVKNLGYDLGVTILEADNNKRNSKFTNLANDNSILTYDAIIMPFYGNIEAELATIVAEKGIPVVTAATIAHQQNVNNLFSSLPSINQQRKKMLDYLVSKQGNIVVISDVNRTESKDFISDYVPDATFIDLKKNGSFSEDDLVSTFKKDQLNYVILESERNSVFLNVTNVLLSELNSYSIQLAVLEPSIIPDDDEVSVKRFRILKMLFPSLSPIDFYSKPNNFKVAYKKTYNLEPSTNALLGFDVTFDTLLRLFQDMTFEASAKKDITRYTTLTFDYQLNSLGGYSNHGIFILQYDTDSNLQEAD